MKNLPFWRYKVKETRKASPADEKFELDEAKFFIYSDTTKILGVNKEDTFANMESILFLSVCDYFLGEL